MTDSGKLIHKARLHHGLSQRELADGICSAAHISRLERGRCLPSPDLLLQLVERLEVNTDDLVRSYLQSGPALSALAALAVGLTTGAQLNLAREVLDWACEQLSPEHASYQRDVANVYRARSYWHQIEGDMARAQHLARKRLEVVQQLRSNPFVRADAYYQVGSLALRERRLDQAEEHLRRAWYEIQRVDQRPCGPFLRPRGAGLLVLLRPAPPSVRTRLVRVICVKAVPSLRHRTRRIPQEYAAEPVP